MNKYEILFILDNSLTDENKLKLIDKFTQVVESRNGVIVTLDKWGVKKYAYEINHKSEGYYFLMNIESDPSVPLEIERLVNITESVVRFMVIKKDEFNIKKVKRAPKVDKPSEVLKPVDVAEESGEYGSPVMDGVDPEFGIVQNTDITADEPKE